jgi:hypothetical protein
MAKNLIMLILALVGVAYLTLLSLFPRLFTRLVGLSRWPLKEVRVNPPNLFLRLLSGVLALAILYVIFTVRN